MFFRHILLGMTVFMGSTALARSEIPAESGLCLTVHLVNLQKKPVTDFAIDEPVWLCVELKNTNSEPMSIWLNGDKNRGITCRPEDHSREKIKCVSKGVSLEQNFHMTVLSPGKGITVEVPLGDFMAMTESGTLGLLCAMEIKDQKRQWLIIESEISVHVNDRLTSRDMLRLFGQIKEMLSSGDEQTRIRMVRSCHSLPGQEKMAALTIVLADDTEDVQLAALEVFAMSGISKEQAAPFLQKALQSKFEAVRSSATFANGLRMY